MKLCYLRLLVLVPLAAWAQSQAPASKSDPAGIEYFETEIRPLLSARCYGCHSSRLPQPMGKLLLDSRAGMLHGGQSGVPAIVAGNPSSSLLIAALKGTNPELKMPPGKPLAPEDIAKFEKWIAMGAPDPRTVSGAAPPPSSYDWTKARRHWSYQPIRKTEPPPVSTAEWIDNPIDRFIKARLDAEKLMPAPVASRPTLIRRVTFDITGLPPTPEELDAFLTDKSSDAYPKLVDRLLASQAYGERWGRHWLDVARYADTAGDNSDYPVPSLFRYRNWVIAAFNRDMPFNQFLTDQLAGDIVAARQDLVHTNVEAWQQKVIATGYLANARRFGAEGGDQHLTIDDVIDNLGKGMLGMTLACARCHDHKFDAVPTSDYYALYGIFASTQFPHPGSELYKHTRGFTALNPAESPELRTWENRLYGFDERWLKANHDVNSPDEQKRLAARAEQRDIEKERLEILEQYPYFRKAYAVTEGVPVNGAIFVKGDPKMKGPEVPRGFLTVLGGQKLPPEEKGSGRLELAQWITDPHNPLTARVIVNRVWEWNFGQGLVDSPDDFGVRGTPPSNPELLDYLASWFMENGWSIRKLNRMILLSRTYRSSVGSDAANALKDPGNRLFWRANRQRLDAEEFRDALLSVSGRLDPAPGAEHPFPKEMEWRFTEHNPFLADEKLFATNKRSVYLMQQRMRRNSYLALFDGADPNAETGKRPLTTSALQALFRMNDPFFFEQADALAARVSIAYDTETDRLRFAWRLAYGREPADDELSDAHAYLQRTAVSLAATGAANDTRKRQAWDSLMRVVLSSNEFLTIE